MKNQFLIIGVTVIGAMAYILGNHLANEAMAVAVGALCGITASIPVSLALFIAANRNWGRGVLVREEPPSRKPRIYAAPPPVFVINPQQLQPSSFAFQPNPFYLPPQMPSLGAPREFKIVGDD